MARNFPFNSVNRDKIFKLRINYRGRNGEEFSRKALAELLNFSHTAVTYVESGERPNPSFHLIIEYCRFFNVSPYELMQTEVGGELLDNYLGKLIKEEIISAEAASKIKAFHLKKK